MEPAKNKSKKWWKIFLFSVLTLLAIFLVAGVFYVINLASTLEGKEYNYSSILNQLEKYPTATDNTKITGLNNYWLGSSRPKLEIVEFGDFNCPNTKNSFTKIRELGLKYQDSVKIIYRDYPVYEDSMDLALAGRCAGEQGLFWLMHDKLLTQQDNFSLNDLSGLANQIGANVVKFNNCLNSKKYLNDIKKDYADGEELGVKGTPTWFINGFKIEGDIPYDLFAQIVEKLSKR